MNNKSNRREINGLVLIDKPLGITSNAALQQVKKFFNVAKAGHTGSLDPLATGMLPICFGEATKFSQFLLDADKVYRVIGKLGVVTTTGDVEGEIVQTKEIGEISKKQIEKVLAQFRGAIKQIPSMYSALKYQGQPLYKLARQGITVPREKRDVIIHRLDLKDFKDDTFELEVHCSKGTYIRTLIEDIGAALECGAHVVFLRRLLVLPFQNLTMTTISELAQIAGENNYAKLDKFIFPTEIMLTNLTEVVVTETMIFYLRQGQPVLVSGITASGLVKLKSKDGRFLGVGEINSDGLVAPKKIIK